MSNVKGFVATKKHHTKSFVEFANMLLEAEREVDKEIKKSLKDFQAVTGVLEGEEVSDFSIDIVEELGIENIH